MATRDAAALAQDQNVHGQTNDPAYHQNGHNYSDKMANGNGYGHANGHNDHGEGRPIGRVLSITPEQFEKLYLQSGPRAAGDLRSRFGNPTPIGIVSFTVLTTTLSWCLMGFQGGSSASLVVLAGVGYLFAGMGLFVSGIFELFLGNTFPAVVFSSFGGFWLSFAMILDPQHNFAASYSGEAYGEGGMVGQATVAYNTGIGLYLAAWAVLGVMYTFLSLRTNVCFVWILFWITITFALLSAAYFEVAKANAALAGKLLISGGATAFICACAGWYLLFVQLLASLDWPFTLPVGDLSGFCARKQKTANDEV